MRPQTKRVRPTALAGRWYPAESRELRRTIQSYLTATPPLTLPGPVLALVAPHAGYVFSGPTAAHAFAQLQGCDFERVVVLGPLHRLIRGATLSSLMTPTEDAYATPLGIVPVDHLFLKELAERVPLQPVQGDEEHSLEIELPFLQVVLGDFMLVPIMVGEHLADRGALERAHALAAALAALSDARTLMVASTDLSHLEDYDEVTRIDGGLLRLVNDFDLSGVEQALVSGTAQACGAAALVVALRFAELRGARGAQVLNYTNSGDVTGQRESGVYTVGYMAVAAYG